MDRNKPLIVSLIILIILGFFVWAMLPKDDFGKKISEQLKHDRSKADVIFKVATLAEIYDGIKYWELVAKTSVVNKSTGLAKMSDVDGIFYDNGRPTMKFIAPSATWYINKNEISLVTPIGYDIKSEGIIKAELEKVKDRSQIYSIFHLPEFKLKSTEGYWFQAKNLNWKLATKKLLCSGAISLTKGNAVINAELLEADVRLDKVKLTGNPTGEISTNGGNIMLTADEFLIDSATDIIIADKNVTISKDKARIKAGRATFNQRAGTITLRDGVNIKEDQLAASSRTAVYDLDNSKVLLSSEAKAKRSGNEVSGDRMTIYLGRNKIVVEGNTRTKVKEAEIQ